MSDNLEKFISDNRSHFDDQFPAGKVWQNVEAAMAGKQKKKPLLTPFVKWSMAAAAMLMIGTGIYFFTQKNNPATTPADLSEEKIEIPDAPEVNQFTTLITIKQQELKALGKEQPELYQQFISDITQLDSSYNNLKSQLNMTPNRDMLLQAMIQNLQLQLNVLNQQLNIINEIKQSKQYSHEKKKQII